jgi:hypothetical protein
VRLYGEGFKRMGSSRSWPYNINGVTVSDDLSCRMCPGHAMERTLEREGEQEGTEQVPQFHATGGEDLGGVVWRPGRRALAGKPATGCRTPRRERKECGGVFPSCVKDCLLRDTVEGLFAVQGQE